MLVVLGDPSHFQLCRWWSWVRPPLAARCPSGLGHGRPLLPSASRAQAKMPLFLNPRTMPGRQSLPQRAESGMGRQPRFLGQHSSPSDRCQGDTACLRSGSLGSGALPGPCPPGWASQPRHRPERGTPATLGPPEGQSQEWLQDPGRLAPRTLPLLPQPPKTRLSIVPPRGGSCAPPNPEPVRAIAPERS